MSGQPSLPPRQTPVVPIDENRLPSGQCRYILLNPEIKGQRCACVGFTLNRALPGVTCECGHNSCYHIKSAEPPPDKMELALLRRRVQLLEEQLDHENGSGLGMNLGRLARRLGELEDQVEKNKEEFNQDLKGCYRNVNRTWHSVDQLARRQALHEDRFMAYDERLDDHDDTLQRLNDRLGEVNEASIALEERVEELEDFDVSMFNANYASRAASSDTVCSRGRTKDAAQRRHRPSQSQTLADTAVCRAGRATKGWTVHVSLLPTASQPFPFEKDTTAYQRCLSRGLHRMVAIGGTDSESFVKAVSQAFDSLLQGREWMPLEAQLCDAATLQGLPMLRPLDSSLIGHDNYDLEFIRKHCAVCTPNGKAESLYIAMVSDTLSWQFLRRSPCFMEGLEASWAFDPLLDRNDDSEDDDREPSAGDMMISLSTLKRKASSSFGSTTSPDGAEGSSRPKVRRAACVPVQMEELHRHGVETA
ncbi:hypothetical protein DL769_009800 [Monosporascus sp. CRB-8-3]|nr:hypothetical protein DL769_009800 [Monosporascus sp. CRB-8-3]